jgi:hypothetical protein
MNRTSEAHPGGIRVCLPVLSMAVLCVLRYRERTQHTTVLYDVGAVKKQICQVSSSSAAMVAVRLPASTWPRS